MVIMNNFDKIESLIEFCPYIEDSKNKTIVIKYGGSAMTDLDLMKETIKDIVTLSLLGFNIVIVHGGGPTINRWLKKIQIKPKFENGIRITDSNTMEVVQMVLSGQINKDLVGLLEYFNVSAVGLSGKDGNLIIADPVEVSSNNRVGNVKVVNPQLLNILIKNKYIPVVAPIAADQFGNSYNINADIVASEIASSLQAFSLIMLTDTSGILMDYHDPSTLCTNLNISQIEELISNGIVNGGMLPKVNGCIEALKNGVKSIRIIDGRLPHTLLLSMLTQEPVGSIITL